MKHIWKILVFISFFIFISGCNSITSNCISYYPNITINKIGEERNIDVFFSSNCEYIINYEVINEQDEVNDTITFEIKMINKQTGEEKDNSIITIEGLKAGERKTGSTKLKGKSLEHYEFNLVKYPSMSCS